jgi:uncharacterized membrane protein YphA (DoxX/SURF4 family)
MDAGIFYLLSPTRIGFNQWILSMVLISGGVLLIAGCLTPLTAIFAGLCFLGIAFGVFPEPSWNLHDGRSIAGGLLIVAISLSLLGPGAFSVDGYLFGRREIAIPTGSRSIPPQSR